MFAFPKKIRKDSILRMDLEVCQLDPFLLNDINEYPDPAKQIVGILLKEILATVKKKVSSNRVEVKSFQSTLKNESGSRTFTESTPYKDKKKSLNISQ